MFWLHVAEQVSKHIILIWAWCKISSGRSLRGFRLPPCCSFDERREIERLVVKGLKKLEGDLAGDYFPLAGSRSFGEKPNGMSSEKEEYLRERGNLFQEPDSTLLLSSGCGRHWPDARGKLLTSHQRVLTIQASSTTMMRTSSSGSTKKITHDSSPWKRVITSKKSSRLCVIKSSNYILCFQAICEDHFCSQRCSERRRSWIYALWASRLDFDLPV